MTREAARITVAAERAFLVLVFSLAFMRPNAVVLGSAVAATDVVFIACVLLVVAAFALRRISFRFDGIYLWLGVYAAALALSAVFSVDAARSFRRLPVEFYLIALAVLTINIVRDERMLMRVLVAWLTASTVSAVVSTFTAMSFFAGWENVVTRFAMHHYGTLPPGNYPRIQGTFEYPAMLCNYLTVGLLVLFALWRDGKVRTVTFALLLFLFGIAIAFTLTPGIGGVLAGIALWLFLTERTERPWLSGVSLAGTIAVLAALVVVSSITPFGTAGPVYFSIAGQDITPTARLLSWQHAWVTFAEHPIFGVGLGLPVVNLVYQVPSGDWTLITDAHNVALNVAAQAGLVGVGALAALIVAVIRGGRIDASDVDRLGTVRIALSAAFVSGLVFQGIAGSFENARHLWVLIGLIVAADRITQTPRPTEELLA